MPLPALDRQPDADRRKIMRAVKAKDTKPEMIVRRLAHALGRRFRLHEKSLPGAPDLAFRKDRRAIFVHGCFWHGHDCKRGARTPKTNRAYWEAKIARNRARDTKAEADLTALGWRTLTVWECETRDPPSLRDRLAAFLLAPGDARNKRDDGEPGDADAQG